MRKICVKCGKRKNRKSFPKHIRFKDGLDTRCKKCITKETKIRNKLHKKAPQKKPIKCPICGKIPESFKTPHKWHLDHDPTDKYLRGWLCHGCNPSMGNLGDSLDNMVNAVSYLVAAKRAYLDSKLYSITKSKSI